MTDVLIAAGALVLAIIAAICVYWDEREWRRERRRGR